MDNDRRILHICTAVLVGAVVLRLLVGPLGLEAKGVDKGDIATALLFLQTGRVARLADVEEESTQPSEAPPPLPKAAEPVVFTTADVQGILCNNYTGVELDVQALMAEPLPWEQPRVLILHSHATESYTRTEDYTESSEYRTLNEAYNMVSIGQLVTRRLEEAGFTVTHDRTLHDHPSYDGSYEASRQTAQTWLEADPSIGMILDLHRDAMVDSLGNQIGDTVQTDGGAAAKIMLVIGTWNENWRENMAVAVKLQARLEQLCPGICRPISLRGSRFNQDLSAGALLIEVGAAGNDRQEALRAAEILAEAIASLSAGTVYKE